MRVRRADSTKVDNRGRHVFCYTAWEGKDRVVDVVIAAGAQRAGQDEDGYTASMYAAEND